jgi:hypothetical protein
MVQELESLVTWLKPKKKLAENLASPKSNPVARNIISAIEQIIAENDLKYIAFISLLTCENSLLGILTESWKFVLIVQISLSITLLLTPMGG